MKQDVDGRDKPGHDAVEMPSTSLSLPLKSNSHHLELEFRIAKSGGGLRRKRLLECLHLGVAQCDVDRGRVLLEIFAPLGARDRYDIVAARQQPGECDLRHGDAALLRRRLERPEQREVLLEVALLEARMGVAAVACDEVVALGKGAAEEAAPERRIGHEADAELFQGWQDL